MKNPECPLCEEVNAFAAGELEPNSHADFERHLLSCAQCREAVASTEMLVSQLRALPAPRLSRDLTPLVMAAIAADRRQAAVVTQMPPRPRWPRIATLAALVSLFAGGALFLKPGKPASVPPAEASSGTAASVAHALDWFCQNQEPDGSWDAEKWGGHERFEVALTALPTLALLSRPEAFSPKRAAAIEAATRWLQTQQSATGYFGPEFQGTPYNQSIATLALLHAYRRLPSPQLKGTLDLAIGALLAQQTRLGGWGYLNSPLPDTSITEWHLEALEMAASLGWPDAAAHLQTGRSWLSAHRGPRPDSDEPADSPSALFVNKNARSELDFDRAYFLTASLLGATDEASRQRLAAVRHTLLSQQIADGTASGSWPAADRWGRAGGRLYSTALASLSLRER